MQPLTVTPIGIVHSPVKHSQEDFWGEVTSVIELQPSAIEPAALEGLAEFSHIEVLFHLSQVPDSAVVKSTRHPRGNPEFPAVGILAQRAKARPNRIGATICRLLQVEGMRLTVRGLDAFDQTPVLDVKPVFAEFLPAKESVRQPQWSHLMMAHYF